MDRRAFFVLAATAAVLTGCAATPPPVSDKVSAAYEQGKSLAPVSATPTAKAGTVVIIGDSFAAGNDETPGSNRYGFIDQAVDAKGWEKLNLAVGGTGYVNPGAAGNTVFAGSLQRAIEVNPDLVIVMGGINDRPYAPDEVQAAAESLFSNLKLKLPEARLLVVGPVTPGGPGVHGPILPIRDAIEAAANATGTAFVDPIAEDWFPTKEGLVGPSDLHPNAEGYKMLAAKLAPHLEAFKLS